MKTILNEEYHISDENIELLNNSEKQICKEGAEKDILYKSLLLNIFKETMPDHCFTLGGWGVKHFEKESANAEFWEKRWFLYYVLLPIQEARTYKEIVKIVACQHGHASRVTNSIQLMIKTR